MKKFKKQNKSGFSLMEVMICFAVLGVIGLLTIYSITNFIPKVDKLRFKNANLTFKHALSDMIQNTAYYSNESAFLDLGEAEFRDQYVDSNLTYAGVEKFRNLLLLELGVSVTNANLNCYAIKESVSKPELTEFCYRSDNGIVWSIPNTDFSTKGVVKYKNNTGGSSKYVPVTIYANAKKINSLDGYYENAITIGVRADGSLTLISGDFDCTDKRYSNYAQCNTADMFAAINVKFKK